MNNFFKKILIPCSLALMTSACSSGDAPDSEQKVSETEEAPLAGAAIGGPFTLIDQDGNERSDSEFKGKYRIIYFGYSYCPDVCPVDLQKIMQGFALFEKEWPKKAANIQPFFISIDPERDKPDVLKQYVAAFHPRLIGLTGSIDQIAEVAKRYLIIYEKRESEGSSEYLVDHSRQAYLFGPDGEPLALLPYDGTPQEVAAEIKRWTR